ncbi:MAG: hypothetical protein N3A54_03910 [Patescibacteria group bacterium]|nr:hypothetical protein [Patescibacteria group bacterium]
MVAKDSKSSNQDSKKGLNLKDVFWNRTDFRLDASVIVRSLATGKDWVFPAFVTDFSDSYRSSWKNTDIYGRIDPVYTYQNTVRTISLGLTLVAFDMEQAFLNWVQVNEMTQSLYPLYKTVAGQKIISSPPIFGLKFQNLLREVATGEILQDFIYGVFTGGIVISPDMKNGFLFDQNMVREHWNELGKAVQYRKMKENYGFGDTEPQAGLFILPKFYQVKFDFGVLHTVFRGNEKGVGMSLGGPMISTSHLSAKEYTDRTRTQIDAEETAKRNVELGSAFIAKTVVGSVGGMGSPFAEWADNIKKQIDEKVYVPEEEQ